MNLETLREMFNRAFKRCFDLRQFLFLFLVLLACGILFFFFQGIALYASGWLSYPLKCLPLFLAAALLLGGGVWVCHQTLDQPEGEKKREMFPWGVMIRASYNALPLLMAFLLFWILLALFIGLKVLPIIGPFFGIFLAFAPFILSFGTLALFIVAFPLLFFAAPIFAFEERIERKKFKKQFKSEPFLHLLLLLVGFLPVGIMWYFLTYAFSLSLEIYSHTDGPVTQILQSFFMLLPYGALFTPVWLFFFHFASESYKYLNLSQKTS